MLRGILGDRSIGNRIQGWQVVDGRHCHAESAGEGFVVGGGAEICVGATVFHRDGDDGVAPAIGDGGKAEGAGGVWGIVVDAGVCDHNRVTAGGCDPQWLNFAGAGGDSGEGDAAFTGIFGDGQVIEYVQGWCCQQVAVLQPLNLATAIPGALFPGRFGAEQAG